MRNRIGFTICLLAAWLCTGCSAKTTKDGISVLSGGQSAADAEAATEREVPEGAITDESGDFIYAGNLQTIGDLTIGYLQIPAEYIRVESEEETPGILQYCDVTGTNLITFGYYQGVSYDTLAESRRASLEETEDVEGLNGAVTSVADYPSLQLYCHHTNGMFTVAWFIPDVTNTDNCYFMEFEVDTASQDILACSSTFQTVTDYLTNPPDNASPAIAETGADTESAS